MTSPRLWGRLLLDWTRGSRVRKAARDRLRITFRRSRDAYPIHGKVNEAGSPPRATALVGYA